MEPTFQEKYLYPPSPIYPITGVLLAYFFAKGEAKPYLMLAGAMAGMAVNLGTWQMQRMSAAALPAGTQMTADLQRRIDEQKALNPMTAKSVFLAAVGSRATAAV